TTKGDAMKQLTCAVVVALHLAGCSAMTSAPSTPQAVQADPIKVGDKVVVTLKSQAKYQFVITSLGLDQICGSGQCVRTADITWIEVLPRTPGDGAPPSTLARVVFSILVVAALIGAAM